MFVNARQKCDHTSDVTVFAFPVIRFIVLTCNVTICCVAFFFVYCQWRLTVEQLRITYLLTYLPDALTKTIASGQIAKNRKSLIQANGGTRANRKLTNKRTKNYGWSRLLVTF